MMNCRANYTPGSQFTIDETMLRFRGKCRFRVYMPRKPDKYGLKLWTLCDTRTNYCWNATPYVGRQERHSPYMIPTQQVLEVLTPVRNANLEGSVTVDNYFMSNELCTVLLENGMLTCGTVKKNRPEIPRSMLTKANAGVTKFLYLEDRTLVAYHPKEDKLVALISSVHREGRIDENGKSNVVNYYNESKGGADTFNYMMKLRSTHRKTLRWTVRYFYGLLDFAGINAYVIHKMNGGSLPRHDFLKQIAENWAEPHIQYRVTSMFIDISLRTAIRSYLGVVEPAQQPKYSLVKYRIFQISRFLVR